jgi:hypothetical protein
VKAVSGASGLSLSTVQTGAREVDEGVEPMEMARARGAGRKKVEDAQPGLEDALDGLVEPETRGDPECSLRWTTKSLRNLSDDLGSAGFVVSPPVVGQMLAAKGYSLQAPVKTKEGADHPDRDAQFRYIAGLVEEFRSAGEPVVSVDAKKKEPAPRSALPYPQFSWEELGGIFLGPMAYPNPKGTLGKIACQ